MPTIPVILLDPDTHRALGIFREAAQAEESLLLQTRPRRKAHEPRHWTEYLSDAWAKAGPYNVPMDRREWPPLQALRNSEGAFEALAYLRDHDLPTLG